MGHPSPEQPIAIFYGGTNGSGKTTLRAQYQDNHILIHIDPDQIARNINPSDPRSVDVAAGREAIAILKDTLAKNVSFTMESTLTGKSIIKRLQAAADQGYDTRLRYIGLESAEMNIQRVRQRVKKGGHHIDDAVVVRRYDESRSNLIIAAKIANRIEIWDNSLELSNLIVRIDKGSIEVNPDVKMPGWVSGVLKEMGYDDLQLSPYEIKETSLKTSNELLQSLSQKKDLDEGLEPK